MGSINKTAAAELLRDPETFMLTVFSILIPTYGDEVLNMDPLEIYALVEEDFRADLPLQLENRINAGLTCIPNDSFYTDLRVFTAVCNTLYSGDVGDDLFLEPVTMPEIIWATYEMEMLRGMEDDPEFSPQILNFIRQIAAQEAVDVETQEDINSLRYQFVGEAVEDLSTQLEKIGIDASSIHE